MHQAPSWFVIKDSREGDHGNFYLFGAQCHYLALGNNSDAALGSFWPCGIVLAQLQCAIDLYGLYAPRGHVNNLAHLSGAATGAALYFGLRRFRL